MNPFVNALLAASQHRKAGFVPSDVPQEDADSLIALYNLTDGDNWTNNTGWLTDPVVGNWYGITVSGGRVTEIDISGNGASVYGDISSWVLPSSLVQLRLYHTSVSGDISSWALPSSLTYLNLVNTSVSGDISAWTLPSLLTYLNLASTLVSGDISSWTLPSSLVQLRLYLTSVNGDISAWTLPSSLDYLYLANTSVSGDISSWTLPSSLTYLNLYLTSVNGDISGWTLPSSLTYLNLASTSVSGDISSWTLPSLTHLSLVNTSVSGNISGWTLPSSLILLYLHYTSVSGVPIFGAQAIESIMVQDCGLSQTDVDGWLAAIYAARASFTNAAPNLNLGGTNAAPSGTYQDGDPPTTGKEYAYELVNDPETEGFNTWAITFTT